MSPICLHLCEPPHTSDGIAIMIENKLAPHTVMVECGDNNNEEFCAVKKETDRLGMMKDRNVWLTGMTRNDLVQKTCFL